MRGSTFQRYGHWYIRHDAPRGVDGKRKQRMIACPGMSEEEAEAELTRILHEIARGTYVEPQTARLDEYIAEWIATTQSRHSPSTHERYECILRNNISPVIGHLVLNKIKPLQLQTFINGLAKTGGVKGKGLAPKTIKNIHTLLHASLEQAVKWELLSRNPMNAVEPPKVRRPNIKTINMDGARKLIEGAMNTQWNIPVLLAISTGMRLSEILGLRWEDFDEDRRCLIVRRAVIRTVDGLIEKEPKSGQTRVIPVPGSIAADLLEHRTQQRSVFGKKRTCDDWICTHSDGRRMTPDSLNKGFKRLATNLKIDITLHGLRHTQATECILAGVPAKVVSERLGHSTVKITQDTYTHVLPHDQDRAVDAIEQFIGRSKPRIRVVGED